MDLKIEHYEMERVLGFGTYSLVRLAYHKLTKIRVAIKTYEKNAISDPLKYKNIKREITTHSKLKHPNIINLY